MTDRFRRTRDHPCLGGVKANAEKTPQIHINQGTAATTGVIEVEGKNKSGEALGFNGVPRRSLYVALIVGTVLKLINQSDNAKNRIKTECAMHCDDRDREGGKDTHESKLFAYQFP